MALEVPSCWGLASHVNMYHSDSVSVLSIMNDQVVVAKLLTWGTIRCIIVVNGCAPGCGGAWWACLTWPRARPLLECVMGANLTVAQATLVLPCSALCMQVKGMPQALTS
jgi:hypothetical protein